MLQEILKEQAGEYDSRWEITSTKRNELWNGNSIAIYKRFFSNFNVYYVKENSSSILLVDDILNQSMLKIQQHERGDRNKLL